MGSGTVSASDKKFVKDAAQGGMAEVALGKLAASKASNPDVKQFGQHMVEDHTAANNELMQVAQSKKITLPGDVKPADKQLMAKLSKLSGKAFDNLYVSSMLKDHIKDVSDFKTEASTGQDADVKGFASKTLPTLQGHLDMVKALKAKMPMSGSKMGSKMKM